MTPKSAWIKGAEDNKDEIGEWEDNKNDGVKGIGKKPAPAFCLIGGVREIDGELENETEAFLGSLLNLKGFSEIPDFNDAKDTTQKDVLSFLDRAHAVGQSLLSLLPGPAKKKKAVAKKGKTKK